MRFLDQFARDLSRAWRGLRRAPTFAIIVVATIGIGIGANATILGIMDVAFLRKLPVPNPEQIVRIRCGELTTKRWGGVSLCSFPELRDLQQQVSGLTGLAGYAMSNVKLGGELSGVELFGSFVSGNYFQVLGVHPQRGRFLDPSDADPATPRSVIVISDFLWHGTFAGDERTVGRKIFIGTSEFTIVGITPAGWSGLHPEGRSDYWLPYTARQLATGENEYQFRDARSLWSPLVGRLAEGATLAQVQGSLDNAARDVRVRYPDVNAKTAYHADVESHLVGPAGFANAFSGFIVALLIVGLVHFVACSNVASLFLARAAARRRELGVRMCLGASRARIFGESLAEPLLLAVFGAALGLLLQQWFRSLIGQMTFMSAMNPGLDARVVALVGLVALGTALVFGLAPAVMSMRQDPMDVLRSASASGLNRAGSPASILVLQAAMSLVLLAQSQLLVGKFRNENSVSLGFDDAHVVTARMRLSKSRWVRADYEAMYPIAIERAAAVPGVVEVSSATRGPLEFGGWFETIAMVRPDGVVEQDKGTALSTVGPGYFHALGVPLAAGREFTTEDRSGQVQAPFDVAVVNESFARRFWPGRDAIGQTITFRKTAARVVGVVKDARDFTLSGVAPRVYFPLLEFRYNDFAVVVRTDGNADAVARKLRTALAGIPNADPPQVRTIADTRADRQEMPRILGLVMSAAAGIALILTAIGLYGAVSMWAATRRKEIGIRLALGARAQHVHRLLVLGAGRYSVGGLLVGAIASIALVRVERARYGPSLSMEPVATAIAAALFIAVTTLAAYIPARRASRTNPADVFKGE